MLMFTNVQESSQSKKHSSSTISSRQLVTLMLGIPVAMLSATRGDYVLAVSLSIALLATTYDRKLDKLLKKVKVKIRIWQVVAAICTFTVLLVNKPASAQLFNPLQQRTNTVLTQAGASGVATSITGIFGLMNILVAIGGVGAVVYGGYQQSQGHTLRESFTPLAIVLFVYVGCSFVMRLFLGAGGG